MIRAASAGAAPEGACAARARELRIVGRECWGCVRGIAERGGVGAGLDECHLEAEGLKFVAQAFTRPPECELARGKRAIEGQPDEARERGDHDDDAAAISAHEWQECASQVYGAEEVDFH